MSSQPNVPIPQQQYERLVECIDGIVWEADARTFQFTFVSQQAERLLGYPLEQWFTPNFWTTHLHPEDRDWVVEFCRRATHEKRKHDVEYRMIAADGRTVWLRDIVSVGVEGDELTTLCGIMVDVTERKRAEAALRESEAKLEEAQHIAHVGYWENDLDADRITWSDETYRILGLRPQGVPATLTEFQDRIHPEDRERQAEATARAQRGEARYDLEYRIVRPDGEVRFIHSHGEFVRDEQGRPLRAFGIAQDITERKRVEEALRESEYRLSEAERIAHLGYWEYNLDAHHITWSEETARIFGQPLRELAWAAEAVREMIHPDDRQIFDDAVVRARRGESDFNLQYRVVRPNREVRYVEKIVDVIRDETGRSVRAVGAVQDITERKQAAEQVRKTEERFRALVENSADGVSLINSEGATIYASPAFERIFGLTLEEANTLRLDMIHPDDRDKVLDGWNMLRRTPGALISYEYRVRHKDGAWHWLDVSARSAFTDPNVQALVVNFRDITERKLAEEKLKETTEQLRALSARVQSAREEEAKGIAREIHDELGAALSSLKWDLEEIDEVISESTDPSQLTALRDKVGAMVRLTDTTVDTVRRITSELRPTALDELGLVDALRWHAQQFQARTGIIVHFDDLPESVDLIGGQATAVFRIVQEALTNVLRHAQATRVDITMTHEEGYLVLTVRDNGRGITAAEKAASQSLGLLGMRERAALLGGEVHIEGTEGQGTIVALRVPTYA